MYCNWLQISIARNGTVLFQLLLFTLKASFNCMWFVGHFILLTIIDSFLSMPAAIFPFLTGHCVILFSPCLRCHTLAALPSYDYNSGRSQWLKKMKPVGQFQQDKNLWFVSMIKHHQRLFHSFYKSSKFLVFLANYRGFSIEPKMLVFFSDYSFKKLGDFYLKGCPQKSVKILL